MKVRDYSDIAGPREEGRPAWRPAEANRSHARIRAFSMRAPTMTLRYAQPSPKAPAPSRETARFQWQYVGAQEGIRGHAEQTEAAQFLERPASCSRFRTIPKLDVAGSTPVARSLSIIVSARSRSDGGIAGAHD